MREKMPRTAHGKWDKHAKRADPIKLLQAQDDGRLEELLPIRYGRMLQSPLAFYRGSAAVMAGDLAKTPVTGIRVQACGDCHLMNFGGFATPERNIIFDINDFDETLPAPWEWDVKRLVASKPATTEHSERLAIISSETSTSVHHALRSTLADRYPNPHHSYYCAAYRASLRTNEALQKIE